jgi:hypothetical protein
VRSADPAVDAEELHAVCLLLQDSLAGAGQLEGKRAEDVGVAQRRSDRKRLAG